MMRKLLILLAAAPLMQATAQTAEPFAAAPYMHTQHALALNLAPAPAPAPAKELKAWDHTAHVYGFLLAEGATQTAVPIVNAANMKADKSLMNSRVKVKLQTIYAHDYPGKKSYTRHHVLFDFRCKNHVADRNEYLHYNQLYDVQEGQVAGLLNKPVFIGMAVGTQGIEFGVETFTVQDERDLEFLKIIGRDRVAGGLTIVHPHSPSLNNTAELHEGISKHIANNTKSNPSVQKFVIGLDFTDEPVSSKLKEGSYICIQAPDTEEWDWTLWEYKKDNGSIVSKQDGNMIPYNYVVFTVERYEDK